MPVGFEPRQEKVPLAPEHILRVVKRWQEATELMIWVTRIRREQLSAKVGLSFLEGCETEVSYAFIISIWGRESSLHVFALAQVPHLGTLEVRDGKQARYILKLVLPYRNKNSTCPYI